MNVTYDRKPSFPTTEELEDIKMTIATYNEFPKGETTAFRRDSSEWKALEELLAEANIAIFHHFQDDRKCALVLWNDNPEHFQMFLWTSRGVAIINQSPDMHVDEL